MVYQIKRPDGKTDPQPQTEEQWAQSTLREVLFAAYREQKRARLWRNIWRVIALLVFIAFIAGLRDSGTQESEQAAFSAAAARGPHTAVIDLNGTIGGDNRISQVDMLRQGMEAAYRNKNVRAIIIHANSPGGSPVVSNTAFSEIRRIKAEHANIPVYVVAKDMCASGCYYIAAAADKIFADPSSLVGSIGVIGSSFDATGLIEKLGIRRRVRIAGDNKGMGDPFVPETPEQQAIWQNMLNQIHGEFIKAVREGRGKRLMEKEFPDMFSGRIFTGIDAKKAGLIDDFGNVYSVARDVVKAPNLVHYTPEKNDLASLLNRHLNNQMEETVDHWLQRIW